jgi:hypothetical protein
MGDSTKDETLKQRELLFAADPPDQAVRALEVLGKVNDLQVEPGVQPNSLRISYNLLDHSLEELEKLLTGQGFSFDSSVMYQIDRRFIHYSEEVEYHNLNTPERLTKSGGREIFVKAYDRHLHGDHDDTPPALRDYK